MEITDRAIVVLNLIDEAKRKNIEINQRELTRLLGIPVVAASARTKVGMDELLDYINQVATGRYICRPHRIKAYSTKINKTIDQLSEKIKQVFPDLPNIRWVAVRLLEGDQTIIDAIKNGDLGNISVSVSNQIGEAI